MSTNKIKELIQRLSKDPKAQEMLKTYDRPAPGDELRIYVEIAGKLGYDISEADLKTCIEKAEKALRESTDSTMAAITDLPDDALSQVAGGKDHSNCKDTFKNRENCWTNDGCDNLVNDYDDYLCHYSYYKHECKEKSSTCGEPSDCGWADILKPPV